MNTTLRARAAAVALAVVTALALATDSALAAPARGGAANLAMIGEPQTLDPMSSTADLVGTIMQHVYELLYTYDANSNVVPMLAESMPTVSKDGLVYAIPLRKGVRFHNGKEMTSADVIASLQRWMEMAPRGKAVAKEIKSLEAKGPNAIVITLNRPYAPLVAHLALSNGFAAIMAKDSIATPLTQFIGTTCSRSASPTSTCSWCASTATAPAASRRAVMAASAKRCSTSCASSRFPTRTRAWKERSRANITSPTCSPWSPTRGSKARPT
jgi:ABC-type transport system substrate-binding protein